MLMRFHATEEDLAFMDEQIKQIVKSNDGCQRLTALEGVGPIGAILLLATLGSGEAFKNGREFSAYIGLTPKQYSSGGKANVVGISRHVANRRLHKRKHAASSKDEWLLALVARGGTGRAAVALANKNVRTAWAMLTQGTEYNCKPCLGNAA
jgi:transposase